MKRYRTTAAHFDKFKAYAEEARKLWGLDEWDITYDHGAITQGALGEAEISSVGRHALIRLSKNFLHVEPTDLELRDTAREEVAHILVGALCEMATQRHATAEALYAAEEALVKRLKKLLP